MSFLSRPESYPEVTTVVEQKETHMSWVFLTGSHAYKLKKPVRHAFLDYSTTEARRRTLEEELRLNRRFAADVYDGMVPLTRSAAGSLQIGGDGEVVDWLIKMRRLPSERMLDRAIAMRKVTTGDTRRVGELLASFYRHAPAVAMSAMDYRASLSTEIQANRLELADSKYRLSLDRLDSITAQQVQFLGRETDLFNQRVLAGRIVEGHGDLRPEHVCLENPPVIIDCLEFNRALRVLDAASELTFLWLECERLGAPGIGHAIFDTYCRSTGDNPPRRLIRFYKSWHACVRAKVAVWHLKDHEINNPAKWMGRAAHYLRLAAGCLPLEDDAP